MSIGVDQPLSLSCLSKKSTGLTIEREQLRNVKSTSAGPDGISGKLLYSAGLELVSFLVTIFNHCVNKGIVIDEWRLGNIKPIPKVQNPTTPSDMRPIAITSTPCKIMERIITKQILRLVRVRLLTNKQFGFLTGRSTTDALHSKSKIKFKNEIQISNSE
ncbi:reverse [Brachionus plicatilis]|uniref:Reverse n=1 Tax=Brachionus plicatilis TaxID=10195 RepID=A0A3M7PC09_BRAPC|nr:reverse [Brachionus plicatilis]